MKKISFVVVGLISLLSIADYFHTVLNPGYRRAQRLTAAISQQLPLGSSKAQVLMFLKQKKVEHSYLTNDFGRVSVVRDAGVKPSQLSGMALSMIRGTSSGFLTTGDTQIVFFFGKSGKLIKISRKEIFTGP